MHKAAGFLFSDKQLRSVASKIVGNPVTETHAAMGRVIGRTLDRVALDFDRVFLPDGMDDDKDKDNKRRWMLILVVRELGKGETLVSFSDIPLDLTNQTIAKGFNWMVDLGYSEDEVKSHWATLSSASFKY